MWGCSVHWTKWKRSFYKIAGFSSVLLATPSRADWSMDGLSFCCVFGHFIMRLKSSPLRTNSYDWFNPKRIFEIIVLTQSNDNNTKMKDLRVLFSFRDERLEIQREYQEN